MSDSRWKKGIEEIRHDLARLEATVAKLQGKTEEPEAARPEPEHEEGGWFVYRGHVRWIRCITGQEWIRERWEYAYDYSGAGHGRGFGWAGFDDWLPIPPRPEKPWGHKLTGEVRVPKHGESYVRRQGHGVIKCHVAGRHSPFDHEVYGQRRWIAEAEAPPYRKGQLVTWRLANGEQALAAYEKDASAVLGDSHHTLRLLSPKGQDEVHTWSIKHLCPAVASDLTPEQWMKVAQDLIDAQGDRT